MLKKYAIGLYEKAMPKSLDWRGLLQCAKDCGYDFVEISIDESAFRLSRLNWTQAECLKMLALMEEIDIPIRSMCLSAHRKYPLGSADPETRAQAMKIMEKAIVLADHLGIRTIQLAGYDVYYEESTPQTEQFFRENLAKAVQMAESHGILLGFETMETEFMNTVSKSMHYVHHINSPYLGVYPDIGNLTNAAKTYHTDVLEDLESGRGHIIAMHLKETVPGKFREIPFLTGHVDFQTAIAKAWELGVRRYVTEMWDVGNSCWKTDIQFANQTMSAILDQFTESPFPN